MDARTAVVAAVNDRRVLESNLACSPVIAGGRWPLEIEQGHASASRAYNAALARVAADVVVFAHQDVYLPRGWDERLIAAVRYLEKADPKWAVLGVFGVRSDGGIAGRAWSTGLGRTVGQPLACPQPVVSLDELLLVLRIDRGIRFDEGLPGYHLYGTDLVQTALDEGLGAYAFDGPVIHNSVPVVRLDRNYRRAYWYMQHKWRDRLPLRNAVLTVSRTGWPLVRNWVRATKRIWLGGSAPGKPRHPQPAKLAQELGFELTA
jgi:hypothetical protein